MARTVTITSRHDLGVEGAKANITARFEALKAAYVDRIGRSELVWHGSVGRAWATMLGQTGNARIEVREQDLAVVVTLPLLLSPFAGFIEKLIRGNADALDPAGDPGKARFVEPPP